MAKKRSLPRVRRAPKARKYDPSDEGVLKKKNYTSGTHTPGQDPQTLRGGRKKRIRS
jgi:hypothetical protein